MRRAGRSRAFAVAALLTLSIGCAEDSGVSGVDVRRRDGSEMREARNGSIGALKSLERDVPAQSWRRGRPDASAEMSDAELVARVRAAGGRVFIAVKPHGVMRTRESGLFPAMSREEVLSLRAELQEQKGLVMLRTFSRNPMIVASIPPEDAPAIRRLPFVNFIEEVRSFQLQGDSTSWGATKVGAPTVWSSFGNTGGGASISILDSGIDSTHFGSELPYTLDCYYDSYFSGAEASCWDRLGHGSHVAGIAVSQQNNAGYLGIARGVQHFASFKVCDQYGQCPADAVVSALLYIDEMEWPKHIVSMSFGFSNYNPYQEIWLSFDYVLGQLYDHDVLLVAAAGNNGGNNVRYPATNPDVIAVSGTTPSDAFASNFYCAGPAVTTSSNYGSEVELSAPFAATSSLLGGTYGEDCGTSMATPVVSAVAALVWTQYPFASNSWVRQRLRSTAVDLGSSGRDDYFGFGRVNAYAAAAPPTNTVTIYGASAIKPSTSCNWTYSTSVSSPNVEWEINGSVVETGPTLTHSASDSFTIVIRVWNDSDATYATTSRYVTVSSEASECYDQ